MLTNLNNNSGAINFVTLQLAWLIKQIDEYLADSKKFGHNEQIGFDIILNLREILLVGEKDVDQKVLEFFTKNFMLVRLYDLERELALKMLCKSFMFLNQHLNKEFKGKEVSVAERVGRRAIKELTRFFQESLVGIKAQKQLAQLTEYQSLFVQPPGLYM